MDPLSQAQDEKFPSLLSIVQDEIKRKYVGFIGDIGSVEINLLEGILAAANPEQLMSIENSTLHGICKRDLSGYTWPFWYTHCINNDSHGFFSSMKTFPPLPPPLDCGYRGQPLGLPLPNGVAPAHYRLCYEQMVKRREDKLAQTGARLKEMREKQEKEKASRSIQVIGQLDRKRKPTSARSPGGSGAFRKNNNNQPSKQQQAPVKERIMKKLHVSAPDLKLNNNRAMLTSTSYNNNKKSNKSKGGGGTATKPMLTAAVLAGRVKVKTPQELAREESERKLARLKAASILNDDDIFKKKR